MNAIVVDDEPIALKVISSLASKVPFLTLKADFTDAFKAIEYLQNEPVDLVFLDIKMPDISGIDFLKSLNQKPMVIFTTAYSEHAVTSFELDAVDYLLKPFSLARFIKACNKAFELHQLRNNGMEKKYLFLKTGYEQVKINFDDVLYLEAAGNYVSFVTKNQKLLPRMTISEAEAMLPASKFMRVHRSYIVALSQVDKIEKHQLWINNAALPIGHSYVPNLARLSER